MWWIEYRDERGKRCRVPGSRIRSAAEYKMAQIVRDVETLRAGKPLAGAATSETFTSLAAGYRDYLADMGRDPKHVQAIHRQCVAVASDCRWVTVADVTLARWARWVGAQEFAAETINHYLRALRGLLRWLVRTGRIGADPLAAAELLNADADRRLVRRVLLPEVFRRLIDTTRASSKARQHLDGPSRAALYLVAARTGFRAGVLAKLQKSDVRLDDSIPHIPTTARQQKNRKALAIPLSAALVAELRAWLASRPDGLLWPGNWHRHHAAAKILRRDLVAAGIPVRTADGVYDFHSFRGQTATDLALAEVPLHITQQFLGHSTPGLTQKFYLRLGLADLARAAEKIG